MRVEFPRFGTGFADVHPWPELGDPPLDLQLNALSAGKASTLVARSLAFARVDAAARSARQSLFENLRLPESHYLTTNASQTDAMHDAVMRGFKVIKIKVGRNPVNDAAMLERLSAELPIHIRLRLDANEAFDRSELKAFMAPRPRAFLERVDFFEDPCCYDADIWAAVERDYGVRLALDRRSSDIATLSGFSTVIIKPAVQDPFPIVEVARRRGLRVAVTSYLDHPVGQLHAAWMHASIDHDMPGLLDVGGFLSHVAYEITPYSEAFPCDGPQLTRPQGTGFGFDDLLEREPWRRLI